MLGISVPTAKRDWAYAGMVASRRWQRNSRTFQGKGTLEFGRSLESLHRTCLGQQSRHCSSVSELSPLTWFINGSYWHGKSTVCFRLPHFRNLGTI